MKNIRNRFKKQLLTAVLAIVFTASGVLPALAATSYVKTISVTLDIDLEVGDSFTDLTTGYTGDDCDIKISNNSRYDIAGAEWSTSADEAVLGKTYNIKITLDALGDYEFNSSYSSSKVTVKGGTFVSAKRSSKDVLVLTVKTKPVEGTLEEPDEAYWQSSSSRNAKFGYAKWSKVDNAAYDVTLYRNDKVVHKVTSLKATTYNFYPYMTKEGDYKFRVRAVPISDTVDEYADKSEWVDSDTLYVDEDEVSDGSGQEASDSTGSTVSSNPDQVGWILSGGKWFFRYPDGTYLRDSWGKINGKWYLFDSTGEMLTGWHNRKGLYYYMNADGAMLTGWIKDNNIWYYLNSDGAMQTGWLQDGDKTYYLDQNGAMITGWREIGGEFYYFHPDGHKAVNEVISGFYVDQNGVWKRP